MEAVERLHFLIHPGFIENHPLSDFNKPEKDRHIRELYIDQSRRLTAKEIMAVFTHQKTNVLQQLVRRQATVATLLHSMRDVLGKRMIVLSERHPIFPECGSVDQTVQLLKHIASQRGFSFNTKTPTVAYGELWHACVASGANALNRAGQFDTPTMIKTRIGEGYADSEELIAKLHDWRSRGKKDESQHILFDHHSIV